MIPACKWSLNWLSNNLQIGPQKISRPEMVTLIEWTKETRRLRWIYTPFFSYKARVISFCFCMQILQLLQCSSSVQQNNFPVNCKINIFSSSIATTKKCTNSLFNHIMLIACEYTVCTSDFETNLYRSHFKDTTSPFKLLSTFVFTDTLAGCPWIYIHGNDIEHWTTVRLIVGSKLMS